MQDGTDAQGNLLVRSGGSLLTVTSDRGGTVNVATSVDANGRVFTPGYKSPRFLHAYDEDTGTWTPRGVLLEGTRTNLVVQGATPTTANGWTATGGVTSVAGSTYAGLAFAVVSGINAAELYRVVTLTGNTTKAVTIAVRSNGVAGTTTVGLWDATASAWRGTIQYTIAADGAITATAGNGATLIRTERLADDVYRFTLETAVCTAANTNRIYANASGGSLTSAQLADVEVYDIPRGGSPILTGATTLTQAADQCAAAFAVTPQAMTLYVRFRERGTARFSLDDLRILQLTDANSDANSVRVISGGGGVYATVMANSDAGVTTSISTMGVGPTDGDLVELLVTLSATGVVQLSQRINGGSVVAATAGAAGGLPAQFGSGGAVKMVVGAKWAGGAAGLATFECVRVSRGVQSFDAMAG